MSFRSNEDAICSDLLGFVYQHSLRITFVDNRARCQSDGAKLICHGFDRPTCPGSHVVSAGA